MTCKGEAQNSGHVLTSTGKGKQCGLYMAEREDQQSTLLDHLSVLLYDVGSGRRRNNRGMHRLHRLVMKIHTYIKELAFYPEKIGKGTEGL